jgi:DNA-binding PadR family transcriptional regulator
VERFVEPALLVVLAEGPTHGYDLAEAIETIAPAERVDLGNLYRLLRSLEEEGIVTSEWRDDLGGRAKRTYALTTDGAALLEAWTRSLAELETTLAALRERRAPTGDAT